MKAIGLEELKSIQLDIMKEIDDFCHKHNIKYYICSGTLIGAVRHKGYIPWDDDIDICMFRSDYDRFFQEFNLNRNDAYKAINISNCAMYYLISGKVIHSDTVMDERIKWRESFGVYVDIFPLDDLPSDKRKIERLNRKISLYRNIVELRTIAEDDNRTLLKKIILKAIAVLVPHQMMSFLIRRINRLSRLYNHQGYSLVGDIANYTYGEGEVLQKGWFNPPVRLSFEGQEFDAPNNYDAVLRKTFGDYMKLPPKEKQKSHHVFIAYWK